jgi:hypothetical protein
MKKFLSLSGLFVLFVAGSLSAQTFAPINTTGYNYDAVAETTTSAANTTGAIDGSNYVMYSAAYGALYNVSTGLPNNGLISAGTRTYQLQAYNVNNMLYTTTGLTDSLTFSTPAAYAGISILCFSTEGAGSVNITLRFTDNTTQVYTGQSLYDWFSTNTAIISGFDRCNRTGGTPANASGNPKMFTLDLPISCTNRAKNVKTVKFQNTGTNPRNCIMAISGAALPTFTVAGTPVSCSGGANGSATITPVDGIAPYTYTWSTTPVQNSAAASSLSVAVYSYTAQDAGICPVTGTVAISQSLVTQPSLTITSSFYTVCAGSSILLSTSGVNTFTWNTSANTSTVGANPTTSTTYTVGGYTSANCYLTGSLNITVNALPTITFTTPASLCINSPQLPLGALPAGGSYVGQGVTSGNFSPTLAGIGSKTLSYTYTDGNSCTSTFVNTIVVNALPVLTFTLSPTSLCLNTPTMALSATPSGGTYTGAGITGSVYNPSVAGVGTKTVTYSYTDANNCTANITSAVIINALPIVSIMTTKKAYCTTTNSLYLNANPSGGAYSGPGITSMGAFSPTIAGVGNHNLVYTYTDVNNCTNKAVLSVTVTDCTGINEYEKNSAYVVYPNPNNGSFSILSISAMELTLTNELGQEIKFIKLDESNSYRASVADLAEGIYFISGRNSQQVVRQKIIVSK